MPFRSDILIILTPAILTSERSLEFMQFWQSLAFGSRLNCFQNLTYGFLMEKQTKQPVKTTQTI